MFLVPADSEIMQRISLAIGMYTPCTCTREREGSYALIVRKRAHRMDACDKYYYTTSLDRLTNRDVLVELFGKLEADGHHAHVDGEMT